MFNKFCGSRVSGKLVPARFSISAILAILAISLDCYNAISPKHPTMDPVTHILTGACLGRAGFNRRTGLATLTLALAAEAPDVDSFTYLGGPVFGLQHHRGITHSFVGAPLVAVMVLA